MEWMESPPVNYSGIEEGDYAEVVAGRWFFSQTEGAIIYRVINTDMIRIMSTDETDFVRFRVVLSYLDSNNNQQFDEHKERLIGLKLQPLQNYQWIAIDANAAQHVN